MGQEGDGRQQDNMEGLEVGLLYLGLHNQLIKKFGVNHLMSRKEFFEKIGRHFLLPKTLRPIIIIEMVEKKLIEKIDRDNIKILECKIDIEKDVSKLYKIAGLY